MQCGRGRPCKVQQVPCNFDQRCKDEQRIDLAERGRELNECRTGPEYQIGVVQAEEPPEWSDVIARLCVARIQAGRIRTNGDLRHGVCLLSGRQFTEAECPFGPKASVVSG